MSAALKLLPRDDLAGANQALEVMRAEARAIDMAILRCDPVRLDAAVRLLAECSGKVVVTGVGKSGHIGRKIAATLTSTGTLAIFMHPAEAFHGDLGVLRTGDVGILLSHSGESEEVLALLPFFRDRQVPTIAILGNLNSTLGRQADLPLVNGVDREACPLNLAPTASTSATLALADGLAMAAMAQRGFRAEDFARNHPGGRLGRRLTLRVADLMHQGADNPTAHPTASWFQVLQVLCERSLGAVNIVDEEGRLVGLVTDGDIRRTVKAHAHESLAALERLHAEQFMTRSPTVVGPDTLAYDALQRMENRPSQISVLPVVEPGSQRCLGLLRLHDLVRSRLA